MHSYSGAGSVRDISGRNGVLTTPLFIAIHLIMIILFAVDTVTRTELSPLGDPDAVYDWSALGLLLVLLLMGLRFRKIQYSLLSISLLVTSLNILLSMSRSPEPGLILDILILLSISVLLSLYFASMVGISHGVITAVMFALYIFRYSDELMWSSRNIVVLVGVYITLIVLVGHFAKKVNEFFTDYRRLQRRNALLSDEADRNSVQNEINGLLIRMSQPLYVKTGNALSTLENFAGVMKEIIDDDRLTEKQRDLSMELSSSLSWQLTGIHHIIRGVSDLNEIEPSQQAEPSCNPVQLSRSLWDDMTEGFFSRGDTPGLRVSGSDVWQVSSREFRIMINGLFRHAISLVKQDDPAHASFTLIFRSRVNGYAIDFSMHNVLRTPEPWEGSALMLSEYAVRILFSGTIQRREDENGSHIHIDLPKS